jgi:hypothetical protein
MKSGEILFLNQLINSLVEAGHELEKAGSKNDSEAFNNSKKTILAIQKEISELIK